MKRTPIAIILTDTHLDDGNEEANIRVYREARRLAKEYGLGQVYHGGDIFEARKAQTQHLLTTFDRILSDHDDDRIELCAVPGNHDKTNYAISASFLDPFRYHKSFRLYRHPTELMLHHAASVSITLAPFYSDSEYIESLESIATLVPCEVKHRVMLTHIGLDQAMMNNGMKVTSLVKEDLFKDYDKVLIGHYHDASDYSARIRYIGSSIQHTFGERADKGITVLYSDLTCETVDAGTPKFFTYTVAVEHLTNKKLAEIKKVKEEGQDQVRVVITGDEAKIKSFDKNRLQSAGIKVALKEERIVKEDVDDRVEAFTDSSISTAFAAFCGKNNLDLKEGKKYLSTVIPQEECSDQTT